MTGDRHDFRVVNDFAKRTSWLHAFMADWARYGIALFLIILLYGWWVSRRAGDLRAMATLVWGPLAAAIALIINQPIVHAAGERRPFTVVPHTLTLIRHAADPRFPSDHATASGAIAIAVLIASRKWGLVATVIAAFVSFSRVYAGVHYPVDVIAGLILGGVIAAVGYFLAVPALVKLLQRLAEAESIP